jgi:Methyltransferase domain
VSSSARHLLGHVTGLDRIHLTRQKFVLHLLRRSIVGLSFVSLILPITAYAGAAKEEYLPKVGQPGKDVVWVPNPAVMVAKLLDMAKVTPKDYVVDLGSGDGRNVIAAAKRGARAHGIEYNPDLVELSRKSAAKEGVSDRATFEKDDIFKSNFSKATVVILFLLPEMNVKLRPKLLDLKPGTRIVANTFAIGDWMADETVIAADNCEHWCTGRLWIVPAKVAGPWELPQGELTVKQNYQTFSGTLKSDHGTMPVTGRLRGDQIVFSSGGTQYTGIVNGNTIDGFARTSGTDSKFRAARRGK